jgi:carboxyl-terminal processing protease
MKIIYVIFIFLITTPIIAQSEQETRNIATLCKVWGFLKYYHPEVAKGKIDWDKEFMIRVKTASALKSKEETSKFYLEWIESLGEVKKCRKCDNDIPDSLKKNFDLRFIDDTTLFDDILTKKLKYIQLNRNQDENYYAKPNKYSGFPDFSNEKPYIDSIFPSVELRLLGLARYWNCFQYFFPYKYLNGSDWNQVLPEMIPKFKYSVDELAYNFAMLELSAKVKDSHAGFGFDLKRKCFGDYWAPFKFKIIEEKAVISGFYNDSLCAIDDLRIGDVITEVNSELISDAIIRNSKFIAASNEPTLRRNYWNVLFNGFSDSLVIKFERDSRMFTKKIKRYSFSEMIKSKKNRVIDTLKILEGNIGYVNMGVLEDKDVSNVMEKVLKCKAIIFDVRNYPKGTMYSVMEFLNDKEINFVQFTNPDFKYPGVIESKKSNYRVGKKGNDNYFKGKVVVLFDENTQSHAEFTVMSLQTAPDVICIGSQTAGADGNVSIIIYPGGYKTNLTGLGVYYPDGRETQRIGIVPDIEVKPTIQGIREGRDEVMEKAIEVINK